MDSYGPESPIFPLSKLAEYTVTASASRRRSLVRTQIEQALDDSGKRRWWYQGARAAICKFVRVSSVTRQDLVASASHLRDSAAAEPKKSSRDLLLTSAQAIEASLPIVASLRSSKVIASQGRRGNDAHIQRSGVRIIVAPDLLFLERGSEEVVGALKLHATKSYKLNSDALLNAACVLFTYLEEHGDRPIRAHCTVVDLFTPAFESAPAKRSRRMGAVDAACEEIHGRWMAMYDGVRAEIDAKRQQPG